MFLNCFIVYEFSLSILLFFTVKYRNISYSTVLEGYSGVKTFCGLTRQNLNSLEGLCPIWHNNNTRKNIIPTVEHGGSVVGWAALLLQDLEVML